MCRNIFNASNFGSFWQTEETGGVQLSSCRYLHCCIHGSYFNLSCHCRTPALALLQFLISNTGNMDKNKEYHVGRSAPVISARLTGCRLAVVQFWTPPKRPLASYLLSFLSYFTHIFYWQWMFCDQFWAR